MSKIGKKPIAVPSGVEVTVSGGSVTVKGPKGTLTREFSTAVIITKSDGVVTVTPGAGATSAIWGLTRALVANMIEGVAKGFQRVLEFNGVGFKAQIKGDSLELILGYTNPVIITAPQGVTFAVDKGSITVNGFDREAVGHVAAAVRAARPPEPYKGTGIKYKEEIIRRKAGKKAATAGTA